LRKEPERAKTFVRHRERPDCLWGNTRMIRAFVFDPDGTLVETKELKALSFARAAAELRPDLNEGEGTETFKDFVGLSRQEVAVGLMRRFGPEGAAQGRMAEFGVDRPWQAYVQIRLRIYETLVAYPDLVLAHSHSHNIALLCDVRRKGRLTALATQSHSEQARSACAAHGGAPAYQRAHGQPPGG
jgi:beta-phosphoglucomutase